MNRFFALITTLVMTFGTVAPVFAQATPSGTASSTPSIPTLYGGEAVKSPLNCFDYYTFGSVHADLQPSLDQTVPGTALTFSGDIVSANPYPILDGTLYVKIFKRNEKTFTEGDGNELVDQFIIKDGITLPAKGTLPLSYEWKVPMNAAGGEYYAAYFFATAKRYNLMGLSFTDDVVGNQAQFTITNIEDPKIAKLSKIDTTLNGQNHHFAAFPLHFKAGDTVTVKTTITNPSDKAKTLPLQWNQYSWDAMNKDNLRFTKTEVVTLAAKETKTVTYEVQPQQESVVYVVATTQDNQAKSILDIRYVRDGIEQTRINFPGITTFPIEAGAEQTLFACAHSVNQPVVPGNILTLTLKDKDGKIIHEYRYEGAITGAMGGFGDKFSTDKNINYATITATLERNGVIVEQVTQTYDCSVIDQNSCLPETISVGHTFDWIKAHLMQVLLIIVIILLLGAIGVFLYKKRRNHIDANTTPMTTPQG